MKDEHIFYKEVSYIVRDLRHLIGGNLYQLRRKRQITLQKLSLISHLSPDVIDRIELGKGEINLIHIARLSRALEINLVTLFASPDHAHDHVK